MLNWLNRWRKKWEGWVGDRDMELQMRSYLTRMNFRGETAVFQEVKLVAVRRPGWEQVFRFRVLACDVRNQDVQTLLFGVIRQDERYNRAEVRVFKSAAEQNETLNQWSEGMIRRHF